MMMTGLASKTAIGIVAGVFSTLFLGYCIYFDHKRHKDPDFKRKLKKRRCAKKTASPRPTPTEFPNMGDHEAVQRFFLQEIQLGEELIGAGDLEGGVDHLRNAVAVCGQPNELLQVLQQTLQPLVFRLLASKLPSIPPRFISQDQSNRRMQEDDVE